MSDTTIIYGMVFFFIFLGLVMPFIDQAFSREVTNYDLQGIEDTAGQNITSNPITIGEIILSIFLMFFWDFNTPLVIQLLILLPLRIVF